MNMYSIVKQFLLLNFLLFHGGKRTRPPSKQIHQMKQFKYIANILPVPPPHHPPLILNRSCADCLSFPMDILLSICLLCQNRHLVLHWLCMMWLMSLDFLSSCMYSQAELKPSYILLERAN